MYKCNDVYIENRMQFLFGSCILFVKVVQKIFSKIGKGVAIMGIELTQKKAMLRVQVLDIMANTRMDLCRTFQQQRSFTRLVVRLLWPRYMH